MATKSRELLAAVFALGSIFVIVACAEEKASSDSDAQKGDDKSKPAPSEPSGRFDSSDAAAGTGVGPSSACVDVPAKAAGADVTLGKEYAAHYKTYELGAVPGVPGPLGGSAIDPNDPDRLLIVGESEGANAKIYAIKVKRGPCKHITGFVGTASVVAKAPNADANLVFTKSGVLLYTRWPTIGFGELLPQATSPSREIDLEPLGMTGGGAGGLGFVPPGLQAAGELRAVTWPEGVFHHLATQPDGQLVGIKSARPAERTVALGGGPGGFAYVPAGSPGFAEQRLIVAEWDADRVATYAVDAQGDPVATTRKELFTSFPKPWGAYFEPITGDFLFLTWGANEKTNGSDDKVFIVQGFTRPPPAPDPK